MYLCPCVRFVLNFENLSYNLILIYNFKKKGQKGQRTQKGTQIQNTILYI